MTEFQEVVESRSSYTLVEDQTKVHVHVCTSVGSRRIASLKQTSGNFLS